MTKDTLENFMRAAHVPNSDVFSVSYQTVTAPQAMALCKGHVDGTNTPEYEKFYHLITSWLANMVEALANEHPLCCLCEHEFILHKTVPPNMFVIFSTDATTTNVVVGVCALCVDKYANQSEVGDAVMRIAAKDLTGDSGAYVIDHGEGTKQ